MSTGSTRRNSLKMTHYDRPKRLKLLDQRRWYSVTISKTWFFRSFLETTTAWSLSLTAGPQISVRDITSCRMSALNCYTTCLRWTRTGTFSSAVRNVILTGSFSERKLCLFFVAEPTATESTVQGVTVGNWPYVTAADRVNRNRKHLQWKTLRIPSSFSLTKSGGLR
jgi:hypothetical protein